MSVEEKALVVVALDHDACQAKHSVEMGLRTIRLISADLESPEFDQKSLSLLGNRLKAEIASVDAAIRQVMDTQQDLIDAIRLEFDDKRPLLRTVRAGELLERVQRSNKVLTCSIELRVARSRLIFVSDERWVERIMSNLLANAVLHSGGSKVLLGARLVGGKILFEVRDNGRGMAPDKIARVFEPIATPSLRPVRQSVARSGLGLYNVRLFTERLGGSVGCISSPGRGTLFRVQLPGPVDREERRQRAIQSAAAVGVRNKVVAILDDDLAVLRSTERAFQALGVEVYADHDPLRWLSAVTDFNRVPDLVLLDFQLNGHNCSLQLDIVKRKWGDQAPKILVITGDCQNEHLTALSRGAPVMRKPLVEHKFEFLLEVLSGHRELPAFGFL
jgi:CheY-like chemotaxis protein